MTHFRVKSLTNKLYAAWGDPGYTDFCGADSLQLRR